MEPVMMVAMTVAYSKSFANYLFIVFRIITIYLFFFTEFHDGCCTLHCVWQRGFKTLFSLSDSPLLFQRSPSSTLERTQAQLLWQKLQN